MKILALELIKEDNIISGILEKNSEYKEFTINKDNNIDFQFEFKKSDYKNLEHFRGVIGKFNPYVVFINPVEKVHELDFNELKKIIKNRY